VLSTVRVPSAHPTLRTELAVTPLFPSGEDLDATPRVYTEHTHHMACARVDLGGPRWTNDAHMLHIAIPISQPMAYPWHGHDSLCQLGHVGRWRETPAV